VAQKSDGTGYDIEFRENVMKNSEKVPNSQIYGKKLTIGE
jgi:hypothetical protein